ncbi:2Fe-2S iron-sulfur cluster-binding protein [Acidithiobacillus caldus]
MTAHFYLDGRAIPFVAGQNVLEALLAMGRDRDVPYFCYHPALGSLGACRQCAVKFYPHDDRHPPRVMMACLLPASPGLQLVTAETDVEREHAAISELLMRNHPHDCPVCDEGGQCHLQDMTVRAGHRLRTYENRKRTFRSQQLGPLIRQEMNRCITCYRCVRFYQDIAGGEDFGVFGSRDRVFFGRLQDGALESPFAGNLAEICPTGVFTDKVYHANYLRPWDLETAPSVCPHCNLGCNTAPGAARGRLRRVRQRPHPDINPHFLCDRGRYGFRHTAHRQRPWTNQLRGRDVDSDATLDHLADVLAQGQTAFLGSPRADILANLAWLALADAYGAPFAAFSDPWQEALAREILALPQAPSLAELAKAERILILGQALELSPSLRLPVQAAVRAGAHLTLASVLPTALDKHGQVQRLRPDGYVDAAGAWCRALPSGKRAVILASADALGPAGAHVVRRLQEDLPPGTGVIVAHTAPNLGGAAFFATDGQSARLREAVAIGRCRHLLALAADPLGEDGDAPFWRQRPPELQISLLDHLPTTTYGEADLRLPMAATAERDGVFLNYEGRFQAFAKVYQPAREQRQWDPSRSAFPLPAGGMREAMALWEPYTLAEALAERGDRLERFRQRFAFYRHYLCPELPAPGDPGAFLPDGLRARFRIGIVPVPHSGSGRWWLSANHWYGDEAQARFALELQSLAPVPGVRLAPGQTEARALLLTSRDGQVRRFPVIEVEGMAADVLALDPAQLSDLGYHPGERIDAREEVAP